MEQSIQNLERQAAILDGQGRSHEAVSLYEQIVSRQPEHETASDRIVAIRAQGHEYVLGLSFFQEISNQNPQSLKPLIAIDQILSLAISHVETTWAEAPEACLELLRHALGIVETWRHRAWLYAELLQYVERHARQKRRLPMYHALEMGHLSFPHSQTELTEFRRLCDALTAQHPEFVHGWIWRSYAEIACGDFMSAGLSSEKVCALGGEKIYRTVKFDHQFYEQISAFDLDAFIAMLPQISVIHAGLAVKTDAVFLTGDTAYFLYFGMPLLKSMLRASPSTPIHVHVMVLNAAHATKVSDVIAPYVKASDRIKVTTELIPQAIAEGPDENKRNYYHTVRFVRFYQALVSSSAQLWMMDIDALAMRDPQPLFAQLSQFDVGMRIRPGRLEAWHQFSACLIGACQTSASKNYFRMVAAYVAHFMMAGKMSWGLDQMALYGVYRYLDATSRAPLMKLWGPDVVDVNVSDPASYFWFTAGKKKFDYALNPKLIPATDGEKKYWQAYHAFASGQA